MTILSVALLPSSCFEAQIWLGQTSHVAMASSVFPFPLILASIKVQDIAIRGSAKVMDFPSQRRAVKGQLLSVLRDSRS